MHQPVNLNRPNVGMKNELLWNVNQFQMLQLFLAQPSPVHFLQAL